MQNGNRQKINVQDGKIQKLLIALNNMLKKHTNLNMDGRYNDNIQT